MGQGTDGADPTRLFYFAYGSNLSLDRMALRCPAARPMWGIRIPGWQLRFERVATMVPVPGAWLCGGIYVLTPACVAMLDRIEGVAEGRYRRHRLRLVPFLHGLVEALTYIKIDARSGPPTPAYLAHLEAGYRDWGFESAALWAATREARPELAAGVRGPVS
ncbi:gamma-glutamylcyclotransferase family protein [Roseospira marina]|nr:gamma-glutamylcyclotransferase family protein [Roseospira marina]MBB4312149.1 hypothetical protein [Roseospira marina]MBB5085835.1 hypothetical protein [Roseospira marina]